MFNHFSTIFKNISINNLRWNILTTYQKIILSTFAGAAISLFFPWKNIQSIPISGLQSNSFLYLFAWSYPILCISSNQPINKTTNVLFGAFGFFMSFAFLINSFTVISGYSVNISGIGSQLFFVSAAINLFFILKS